MSKVRIPAALEAVANAAIIVVAIALVIVLIQRRSERAAPEQVRPTVAIGSKISLPDVAWQRGRHTLLVALREGCRYCAASAPFYKRLLPAATADSVPLIALFEEPQDAARRYLDTLDVPIQDVRRISFRSIPISGTPTIVLVNGEGTVEKVWVGQLPSKDEEELLGSLRSHRITDASAAGGK